jgi:hypothetical protein
MKDGGKLSLPVTDAQDIKAGLAAGK